MKNLLKKAQYLLFAGLAFTAVSCDDDDNGNEIDNGNSILDITAGNANFSILNQALVQTGLDATLDAPGTYTVFAPTNTAFQALLDADPNDGLSSPADLLASPDLRNILLNHVLSTEVLSSSLSDGYVKTLATDDGTTSGNALDLYVDLTSGVVLNGGPAVANPATDADIIADNGVVHIIDGVLTLPTIATLAAANPDLGTLVAALSQEGLVGAVAETSTTAGIPAPFTVFAPTNDAFQALIDVPGDAINDANDLLALPNLSDILLYHVVSGAAVRAGDIMSPMTVDPITMGTFTIDTSSGVVITDATGTATNIIATDITAINGVVHALDFVLRP